MKWFRGAGSRLSQDWISAVNGDLESWRSRTEHLFPSRVAAFERRMRAETPWWLNPCALSVEGLRDALSQIDDPLTLAKLASVHRNGYFREQGVRRLDRVKDASESLPWLLLRCSDWVPQVQDAAREAVSRRTASPTGDLFAATAKCVSLLMVDTADERVRDLFQSLIAFLLTPEHLPLLVDVVQGDDLRAARQAIHLLLQLKSPLEMLDVVPTNDNAIVRILSIDALNDNSACEAMARFLFSSPSVDLRADGLWHLLHHQHDANLDLVEKGLTDRSSLVRDVAQRRFREMGGDLHAFYSELLVNSPGPALLGLGDCGSTADFQVAIKYVDASSPQTRQAALRLVATHGSRDTIPLLVEHAATDSGASARQAIRGLIRHGLSRDTALHYWNVLLTHGQAPSWRRFFYQALPTASRWVALEFALRACSAEDAELQKLGTEMIVSTLGRLGESHLGPSDDLIPELRDLVRHASSLPAQYRDELETLLA